MSLAGSQESLVAEAEQLLTDDSALACVTQYFRSMPNFADKIGALVRKGIDEVIDGDRTGRWRVEQLEKTEKTYIGTKLEILIRHEFKLARGNKLDLLISGHEVDVKYSISGNWMIPTEAMGQICLLLKADEERAVFSIGVVRIKEELLRPKPNKDGKRSIAAERRNGICWILRDQRYDRNLLLHLDPDLRERILSHRDGQPRVNDLFRLLLKTPVPRSVICALGQQKDPMRRLRAAKATLALEGIRVICGHYLKERALAKRYGFEIGPEESISIDFRKSEFLTPR